MFDLTPDSAVLAYRVAASRPRRTTSTTRSLNSTYVREGDEWRLALHQQTPV